MNDAFPRLRSVILAGKKMAFTMPMESTRGAELQQRRQADSQSKQA